MAAQRKLGMSPTGHASATFVRKLQTAKALSPCLSAKRGAAVTLLETRSGTEYRRVIDGPQIRAFDFASTVAGDGRTLEGYAAVYNVRARIRAQGGDFDEEILPKAFARSIKARLPVMQFEHGQDPRVGRVPIAAIQDLSEDSRGLHVRARLFDNPVVEPVRQAIAEGAIKGMSFRFQVPEGGDSWARRTGDVDLRQIADADTSELGPVVFPAYDATSVSVRSILAQLGADERAALVRELAAEVRLAVDLTDLTGRPSTRSAGGGDAPPDPDEEDDDDELGDEEVPVEPEPEQTSRQRLDEGALRVRGILR